MNVWRWVPPVVKEFVNLSHLSPVSPLFFISIHCIMYTKFLLNHQIQYHIESRGKNVSQNVCIYLVAVYKTATFVWSCLRIYICPVSPLVVVHSLLSLTLPSVHSRYLYFSGKSCTFLYRSSKFFYAIFSCVLSNMHHITYEIFQFWSNYWRNFFL